MAKKAVEKVVDEVTDVVETIEEVKEEIKRIVTLLDGTTADFGKRNLVLQNTDTEAGTLTFKVYSGEIIVLDFNLVEGLNFGSLPELTKTIVAYGISSKIKTSLAGVKLEEEVKDEAGNVTVKHTLADAIKSGVESILKGEFSTRNSVSDEEGTLEDEIKYFAVAAGNFVSFPFYNPAFAPAVLKSETSLLFNEEVDPSVISEIVKAWDSLDRKQKNTVRKNQFFRMVEGHALIESYKTAQ